MTSRLLAGIFDGSVPREAAVPSVKVDKAPPERSILDQVRQALRSDEELAQQLQRGHTDALTILFKRHRLLVFNIARRILRNDAEAEDTVQQIFLDAFRSIRQFHPGKGAFKSWLLMFAYHRTFNHRRSLLAAHFFDTDPLDELFLQLPQRLVHGADHRILLEQVLRDLDPRQRRTIELTYYEGLTAVEIAGQTGETVRVVRHNLYRGLERLRKAIDKPADSSKRGPS